MLSSISFASEIPGQGNDSQAKVGIITGQVVIKGKKPLAEGKVFIFDDSLGPPPSREKYWRVPDIIGELDQDGKFFFGIPEGKYYLIAIDKNSIKGFNPPEADGWFYYEADSKGEPKKITVNGGTTTNLDVISTAFPFSRSMVRSDKGITAAEGVVVDMDGKPVEGALVLAFAIAGMQPRPLFVSERTGKDGKFIIRTHDGGNYSLRVRSIYGGGPPETGEIVGSDGPTDSLPITLKKGEKLKGFILKVKRFPKRGARYEEP
jgi:hypothetical protein